MKLILLSERGFIRTFNIKYSLSILLLVSLSAGLLFSGWFIGYHQKRPILTFFRDALNDLNIENTRQADHINQLSLEVNQQISGINQYVSTLQLRMAHIETLVRQVNEWASLNNFKEFKIAFPITDASNNSIDKFTHFVPIRDIASTDLTNINTPYHQQGINLLATLKNLENKITIRLFQINLLKDILHTDYTLEENTVFASPVSHGSWLSSAYGYRIDPFTGQRSWHNGMDFAGRSDADVLASASGVVTYVGNRNNYGNFIEIAHKENMLTRYAHNKKLLVQIGDIVNKGQIIAKMGSSGRSTGPHVHFEILKNNSNVNPSRYIKD